MNWRICILLFLAPMISFAQADQQKPVLGTKVSMVAPKGFTTAKGFTGFQDDKGASIMVSDLPANYKTIEQSFTRESLQARGMTLIQREVVDLRGANATLLKVSQKANDVTYLKQIFVFGDSLHTVIINGIYPEGYTSIETDIKKALLSAHYNPAQNDNAENAVDFKVDVTGTPFKFAKNMSGGLAYTGDGQIPTKSADKALLIVTGSLGNAATGDRKAFSIARMKMLPRGESIEISQTNAISVDGLDGYELVGYGKDATGNKQLVYVTFLFMTNNQFYIVNGSSTNQFDSYVAMFRKITNSFRRK